MNENRFSITQRAFPFMLKQIEVDIDLQKIKVRNKTLFGDHIFAVNLYEVEQSAQHISNSALGWFIFALFSSLYLSFSILGSLYSFLNSFHLKPLIWMFSNIVMGFLSWIPYLKKQSNLLVYTNRFNAEQQLFSLFANSSDKQASEEFISKLDEILADLKKGRNVSALITSLMKKTQVQILLNEFRTSYVEELLKKGVDVVHLLESLKQHLFEEETSLETRNIN